MISSLVDTLKAVFQCSRGTDNSFKKTTFKDVANSVRLLYKGSAIVNADKYKNK